MFADIALRGLSLAVNDPTTAVQALDATDSLLRPLAARDLDIGWIRDEYATLRVSAPMRTWEDFITVALDEVIPSSGSSIHVRQRIRRMLAERHAALQAWLDATAVQSEQL